MLTRGSEATRAETRTMRRSFFGLKNNILKFKPRWDALYLVMGFYFRVSAASTNYKYYVPNHFSLWFIWLYTIINAHVIWILFVLWSPTLTNVNHKMSLPFSRGQHRICDGPKHVVQHSPGRRCRSRTPGNPAHDAAQLRYRQEADGEHREARRDGGLQGNIRDGGPADTW